MTIRLDGAFEVASAPAETFGFLTDPLRFAPMLPYFQELKPGEGRRFTVVLEVGVPQIRGRVEVDTELVEAEAPGRVVYRTSGRHPLGMIDSRLDFAIEALGDGSRVAWKSEGVVSGTLASLAQGLLVPLAKRQIKSLVVSVQDALGTVEPAAASAEPKGGRASSALKNLFAKRKDAAA